MAVAKSIAPVVEVVEVVPTAEEVPPTTAIAIEELNFRQLKNLAKLLGIPRYSGLRQKEMLVAVEQHGGATAELISQAIADAKNWKTHADNRKN
jgi:hypothetical protein